MTSHYHIYKVEDIPPEFQFGGEITAHKYNYRLAPIWILPDVGYSITTHKQMEDNGFQYKPKGVHGYNNTHLLMRAIFLELDHTLETKFKSGTICQYRSL